MKKIILQKGPSFYDGRNSDVITIDVTEIQNLRQEVSEAIKRGESEEKFQLHCVDLEKSDLEKIFYVVGGDASKKITSLKFQMRNYRESIKRTEDKKELLIKIINVSRGIEEIDLAENNFDIQYLVGKILPRIFENIFIEKVNLSSNNINDEGAKKILESLKKMDIKSIYEIDLSNNPIFERGTIDAINNLLREKNPDKFDKSLSESSASPVSLPLPISIRKNEPAEEKKIADKKSGICNIS